VIEQQPLVELLQFLKDKHYCFTTVTPATHSRVIDRPPPDEPTMRDIFGWSRPFAKDQVQACVVDLLRRANALETHASGKMRSLVRVASLSGELFVHSAFPTNDRDAVFFGPDTYRFWNYLKIQLGGAAKPEHLVDLGAGSGAGGILASRYVGARRTTLVDINQVALSFAAANAAACGVHIDLLNGGHIPDGADLVIANPPYLMDQGHRSYRDGGTLLGGELSLDWARQALKRMSPGGVLLMYTGAAFMNGSAPLLDAIQALCLDATSSLQTCEIDPDVFGEELCSSMYGDVERIAAVGVRVQKARRPWE